MPNLQEVQDRRQEGKQSKVRYTLHLNFDAYSQSEAIEMADRAVQEIRGFADSLGYGDRVGAHDVSEGEDWGQIITPRVCQVMDLVRIQYPERVRVIDLVPHNPTVNAYRGVWVCENHQVLLGELNI